MILIKYKLNSNGWYDLEFASEETCYPIILKCLDYISKENDEYIMPPHKVLVDSSKAVISPMYIADITVADTYWGFYNNDAIVIDFEQNEINLWVYSNSKPVAHAIFYDFINERHLKNQKALLDSYSNYTDMPKNIHE